MGSRRWIANAALLLILLFGAGLRLSGISFGLPYHHHWDEGWIVDSVVGMLRRHDDVPASYQYGEPLMRLTELGFVVLRSAEHACCGVSPMDAQITVYLVARVVTALISSTGILALYMATRSSRAGVESSTRAGLAAALLFAVASELVLHSRYAVTDASLVALTGWTLAFGANYLTSRRMAWGFACAMAAGVTCAFKVPGIVTSLVPLFCAAFLFARARKCEQPWRAHAIVLLATVPLVLGTYVLLNPHVVDRSSEAVRDLVSRYKQTRDGGFSSVYLREPGIPHLVSALGAIVTQFPSRSLIASLAISATAAWGIVQGARRRQPLIIISAAYATCLVLSVALFNRTFLFRNYIVVIAVVSLGFGNGIADITSALQARGKADRAWVAALAWLLVAGASAALVGLPLFDAVVAHRYREDPRARAVEWLAQQSRDETPVDVGTTPSVFGKAVMGGHPELDHVLSAPEVRFLPGTLDACPDPVGGPEYVLDASYRDVHKAPSSDPWQELWFFKECTGYEQAAAFALNPSEVNLRAYPTWPGRVSAIVLRRTN